MPDENNKIIDVRMPVEAQKDMFEKHPELEGMILDKFRYQIEYEEPSGRVRYAHTNDKELAELYFKKVGAKILRVVDLHNR